MRLGPSLERAEGCLHDRGARVEFGGYHGPESVLRGRDDDPCGRLRLAHATLHAAGIRLRFYQPEVPNG